MATTIVVEDGTGLTNSTSYVSIQEFKDYWTNKGVDYTTLTDDTIAIYVNDATEYADSFFCYDGAIISEDQALMIPRTGWQNLKGKSLDNTVPTELKKAVFEIAAIRKGAPEEKRTSTGIKSKTAGPVSVTYADSGKTKITYPTAVKFMKGLLCKSNVSRLCLPK